jgi:DNA ligase-1
MDPTGWWLSPKLDGVRAIWDGKALYSRNGNRFHAPPSFTACLPKEPLDGELYLGPGAFSETVSIVKSATDKGWGRLTFEVFDAPAASGDFEARQRRLKAMVSAARGAGCRLRLVPQILCTGAAHLRRFHADQVAKGVEGTMLRAPRSPYEARRSGLLRKLKDFLDMEVEIVDTYAGTGKLKGLIGGYVVKAKDGTIFKVGSGLTDAQRARPLRPGTRITIAYQERSKRGSPRFPTYVGERADEAV